MKGNDKNGKVKSIFYRCNKFLIRFWDLNCKHNYPPFIKKSFKQLPYQTFAIRNVCLPNPKK